MTDELKAALERYKANAYDARSAKYVGSYQWQQDILLLADAYVELMARRESSLEQGEFHAPTLAWFEWLIDGMRFHLEALESHMKLLPNATIAERMIYVMLNQKCRTESSTLATFEGWKSKFESCGAFDSPSPIIDETITLDPAHADLRGEYHDISLLLASADELKPRPELAFGKRYRIRVELVD